MQKIALDFETQAQPYFIYERINLTHFRDYFTYHFTFGWNYLLRKAVFKWPEIPAAIVFPNVQNPYLDFEFFSSGNIVKSRQNNPVGGRFYGIGSGGVSQVAAPSPVDNDIYSVCFSAQGPKYIKIVNWLYMYQDALRVDITAQNGTLPAYCDVLLEGYQVLNNDVEVNR